MIGYNIAIEMQLKRINQLCFMSRTFPPQSITVLWKSQQTVNSKIKFIAGPVELRLM